MMQAKHAGVGQTDTVKMESFFSAVELNSLGTMFIQRQERFEVYINQYY